MFCRKKIIFLVMVIVVLCLSIYFGYSTYNAKLLHKYIESIDLNNLEHNCLIVDGDDENIEVSIDTIIFKLELEKMMYDINDKFHVKYLDIDRYSKLVRLEFSYKNVNEIVEYELICVDKMDD